MRKKILITGGAGFIGSNLVRRFVLNYPQYDLFNLDFLTYAGNLENLKDIENEKNYFFIYGDINDTNFIKALFKKYNFDSIIHLAAESHVDKSISDPLIFAKTNTLGTINLLQEFKNSLNKKNNERIFYHVSTDEVFGSLTAEGYFTENSKYQPNSPYSASKASSDHFVRAYGETYNLPYIISNCSNNYGPFQFPEKLIPLFINNILKGKKLPVYGDGNYTRDWLYVEDHAAAIDLIFHKGVKNETYNIGGFNEWKNIDLIKLLCLKIDEKLGREKGQSEKLITYVKDRPGHDLRYAIDATKIQNELAWSPTVTFEEGLSKTIDWYLDNSEWMENILSGDYKKYHKKYN